MQDHLADEVVQSVDISGTHEGSLKLKSVSHKQEVVLKAVELVEHQRVAGQEGFRNGQPWVPHASGEGIR